MNYEMRMHDSTTHLHPTSSSNPPHPISPPSPPSPSSPSPVSYFSIKFEMIVLVAIRIYSLWPRQLFKTHKPSPPSLSWINGRRGINHRPSEGNSHFYKVTTLLQQNKMPSSEWFGTVRQPITIGKAKHSKQWKYLNYPIFREALF